MLATIILVLRLLTLGKLGAVVDLLEKLCNSIEDLEDIAQRAGSFFTVRGNV